MRRSRRRGKWHVIANFSTICKLSSTALLNLTLFVPFFPLSVSIALSIPMSHNVNLSVAVSERRHPTSFRRLSRWVHSVNYQSVIDLSLCTHRYQDSNEKRMQGVNAVNSLCVQSCMKVWIQFGIRHLAKCTV